MRKGDTTSGRIIVGILILSTIFFIVAVPLDETSGNFISISYTFFQENFFNEASEIYFTEYFITFICFNSAYKYPAYKYKKTKNASNKV